MIFSKGSKINNYNPFFPEQVFCGLGLRSRGFRDSALSPGSHLVKSISLSGAMFLEGSSDGRGLTLRCVCPDFGQLLPNKSVSLVYAVLRAKSRMKTMLQAYW